MIKYDNEIFDSVDDAVRMVWWLLHLLGDEIVIPDGSDDKFWSEFPKDASLVLFKENGVMKLAAERLDQK